MNLKDFLAAGYRLVPGDVYITYLGKLVSVGSASWCSEEKANKPDDDDENIKIVYAKCLQKEPPKQLATYEHCGFTNIVDAINSNFDLYTDDRISVKKEIDDYGVSFVIENIGTVKYTDLYRKVSVKTRTVTYPAPETEEPDDGGIYFQLDPEMDCGYKCKFWRGVSLHINALENGAVYLNEDHIKQRVAADRDGS